MHIKLVSDLSYKSISLGSSFRSTKFSIKINVLLKALYEQIFVHPTIPSSRLAIAHRTEPNKYTYKFWHVRKDYSMYVRFSRLPTLSPEDAKVHIDMTYVGPHTRLRKRIKLYLRLRLNMFNMMSICFFAVFSSEIYPR